MARADLLCELIKYGLVDDNASFRKAAEAICADERSKQHTILANKIEDLLKTSKRQSPRELSQPSLPARSDTISQALFTEIVPRKRLDHLILPDLVRISCLDLIKEHHRIDLLRSYGIEPRNKLLLIGPPGNGKTSLAEAIAESMMLPLISVRYESIIGSYLGETASRLSKLFEYVKSRECVLFFDEFETLGKERGDVHETGEIKRVVSSLLMQIDNLPSYVVIIAATNHDALLDKAAWRRFQIKLEIPKPTRSSLEEFYRFFEKEHGFKFGMQISSIARKTFGISYAEAEEFALSVYRQYILGLPDNDIKNVTAYVLQNWQSQLIYSHKKIEGGEDDICQTDQ